MNIPVDFKAVFEELPLIGLLVEPTSPGYPIQEVTHEFLLQTKLTRNEIIGQSALTTFPLVASKHGKNPEAIEDLLQHCIREGKETKLPPQKFQCQDEQGVWRKRYWGICIKPIIGKEGNVTNILIHLLDSTALKRAKKRGIDFAAVIKTQAAQEVEWKSRVEERTHDLQQQKAFIRSILDASSNAIYALEAVRNEEGTIIEFTYLFANSVTTKFIGISEYEIIGKKMLDLFPENKTNGFFDLFCETLSNGKIHRDQTYFVAEKFAQWFDFTLVPLDKNCLVITVLDISAQKKHEEQIQRQNNLLQISVHELQQLNASLEQFNYAASHDLQEPLRKILTFCGLLSKQDQSSTADTKLYISKIMLSANRMKDLLNDLLSYAQATQLEDKFEPVAISAIVKEVQESLELVIAQKKAQFIVEELPVIPGIAYQLNQVFVNLIGNALKFSNTKETPVIRIASRTLNEKEIHDLNLRDGTLKYTEITVEDNGIGFDQMHAKKIFHLFTRLHVQRDYKGTGIGLAICAKIVNNHGGTIYATSTEGTGSVFHVVLPLHHPPSTTSN